jgi:hypothetical protein
MIQGNLEIELSIADAKVAAQERQPVRYDVYLKHISYYEDCIETLKSIIKRMNCKCE